MLQNWIKPLDLNFLKTNTYPDYTFANNVHIYDGQSSLDDFEVALIGLGPGADEVRRQLLQLSFPFRGLKMVDLGNARKTDVEFTIPIVKEILESKLFPIVIGQQNNLGLATYKAFTSQRPLVSMAIASETLYYGRNGSLHSADNYLAQILSPPRKESHLFHFACIGCQTHFLDVSDLQFLESSNFDCVRLGRAKQDLIELEPLIRDADVFNFHLDSIRFSDAPGQLTPTPSGFSLDQGCQITRYAGMSDKLRTFSLLGYYPEHDIRSQTAGALAQLIWYFLDGFYNRKHDFPVSSEGLTEYLVEMKSLNYEMAFWKSQKSGRWWMQIPVKTKKQYERHCLIPCSYSDYKLACNNDLPDRLLNALRRFS